jgi:hypothetical protein
MAGAAGGKATSLWAVYRRRPICHQNWMHSSEALEIEISELNKQTSTIESWPCLLFLTKSRSKTVSPRFRS